MLAHLCTVSAVVQLATAVAAPTATAAAAAVLQDLVWNGLIPKKKLSLKSGICQLQASHPFLTNLSPFLPHRPLVS